MRLRAGLPPLALGCVLLAFVAAGTAGAAEIGPSQRRAIEGVIHDYLLSHPEVLLQALNEAEKKLDQSAGEGARQAIAAHRRALFNDPATPVGGNPAGNVTIVEFFDYSCPYCKAVEPTLERLLGRDHNLRFVYKEFPVLGPESVTAARAALAASRQGKYVAFHDAMMTAKGPLDDERIYRVAGAVGLDLSRLKRDMAAPWVTAELKANMALAAALGVQGTPTFVIGHKIVPGAVDLDRLERLIAAARKG
jgi:protein-disulfide isomerase